MRLRKNFKKKKMTRFGKILLLITLVITCGTVFMCFAKTVHTEATALRQDPDYRDCSRPLASFFYDDAGVQHTCPNK